MFIPDLGSGFLSIPYPDPGSGGQKSTGSRIRIRNTGTVVLGTVVTSTVLKHCLKFYSTARSVADPDPGSVIRISDQDADPVSGISRCPAPLTRRYYHGTEPQ